MTSTAEELLTTQKRKTMPKRKMRKRDVVQAWYDEGQARAAAVRQARGPPDAAREEHLAQRIGFGGWGGRKLTKEEAEASARSCEASRDRTARARAADHQTLAETKKQKIDNGVPVSERTRDGGFGLALGVGSTRVVNCKPAKRGPYSKPKYRREGNLTNWGPGAGSILQAVDRADYDMV